MVNEEIWKDVIGFEGYYQVSNKGNVKSLKRTINNSTTNKNKGTRIVKERILSQSINNKGYKKVSLQKDNKRTYCRVHRLVAEAFCNNDDPDNKTVVNHIDGNKLNNNCTNLEWVTYSENNKHAYDTGLKTISENVLNNMEKMHEAARKKRMKLVEQLDLNGNLIATYESVKSVNETHGYNIHAISRACRNPQTHSAYGYKWRYKE